mgnify:CR=1 FL=1|jgi:hypothetical protein
MSLPVRTECTFFSLGTDPELMLSGCQKSEEPKNARVTSHAVGAKGARSPIMLV